MTNVEALCAYESGNYEEAYQKPIKSQRQHTLGVKNKSAIYLVGKYFGR